MAKTRGSKKGENFSAAQTAVLLDALRALWVKAKAAGESQESFGKRLGDLSQQRISSLMDPKNMTGMTYPTAVAIARASDFISLEAFFDRHGVGLDSIAGPQKQRVYGEHTAGEFADDLVWAIKLAKMLKPPIPDWIVTKVIEDSGGPHASLEQSIWLQRFITAHQIARMVPPSSLDTTPSVLVEPARKKRTN